jgi:hypothetical protein
VLVSEKLDAIVRASSLGEMVNAFIRPYLNRCKGQITQETLNLIMFYHNHRRYNSGKRKGKAPIELLTGEPLEADWVELLIQHRQDAILGDSMTSRPPFALVPNLHECAPQSETPPGQARIDPKADSDNPWRQMDAEAA